MHRELEPSVSNSLRAKMRVEWEWDGGYWHPINPIERDDLLGFDATTLEKLLPEASLRSLLERLEPGEAVLFREHDPDLCVLIQDLSILYGRAEALLAPKSLSWLVYWSHEDTVAFGGAALLAAVKEAVPHWESALWR